MPVKGILLINIGELMKNIYAFIREVKIKINCQPNIQAQKLDNSLLPIVCNFFFVRMIYEEKDNNSFRTLSKGMFYYVSAIGRSKY